MTTLTEVEDRVLEMLLRGEDEILSVLREQAKHARISSRKMTGVGFYTEFLIPSEVPRVHGSQNFELGDVNGTADTVKHGLGFVLFVKNGALSMLEGYTYDDPWPREVQGLVLTYSTKEGRKLDFQSSRRN